MPRLRRCILSKKVYEVCFRTRKGLPFVCTAYMKLILESILARAQRDYKVDICHLNYMGNHPHMLLVARDSLQFKNFYGEVKKQTTEAMKRLLGRKHLCLWQKNGTNAVLLEDEETIIERIAYFYNNPVKADLIDTIDRYPGLNTWRVFTNSEDSVDYEYKKDCLWIRQPLIAPLPCKSLTEDQDRFFCNKLKAAANLSHELIIKPNAWMVAFVGGCESEQVKDLNRQIIREVREKEQEYRELRNKKGIRVKGATRLKTATINLTYRPKKFTNAVFVISRNKELRKEVINWYKEFCQQCADCYQKWKEGDFTVKWPPGAYAPVGAPHVNLFQIAA